MAGVGREGRGRAFRYNLYSVILLQRQVSLYQLHSRFFILVIQKEREEGSWSWRSEKERDGGGGTQQSKQVRL